jgi:outer membrane protein, multidrug efflux system
MNLKKLLIICCISVFTFIIGCSVGPNYRKPQLDIPEKWSKTTADGYSSTQVETREWWKIFKDPMLDSLIERAVNSNLDIKIAESRIKEARLQRRMVIAEFMPNVDATGSYTRLEQSNNGLSSLNKSSSSKTTKSKATDLFQAGFDASWEIDIFGGVRRAAEAAAAYIASTKEGKNEVMISLLSEVARNYFDESSSQIRIEKLDALIEAQRKILDLTRAKYDAGLASKLELISSESQLKSIESQKPLLETVKNQSILRLGVLLGQEPNALVSELSDNKASKTEIPEIPVGLPSDLLQRRPDIRRAEFDLKTQTALIGVAKSDLFPKISLTGAFGYQSLELSDLLHKASEAWSFGPSIRWSIFDAGKIRTNIKIQNERQKQALLAYQSTILSSLEDVENALTAYAKERERNNSLNQIIESKQNALDISNDLYKNGLIDLINLQEIESDLYRNQDSLIQSDNIVVNNLIALFKALGGGWEIPSESTVSGSIKKQ